jgi:hypothetical protein
MDLGKIRAHVQQGRVTLEIQEKDGVERGFSQLIKEPGLYRINGITVKIRKDTIFAGAEEAFCAGLPLVLRPPFRDELKGKGQIRGYTTLLAAEDAGGMAALIGRKGATAEVLARRPPGPAVYEQVSVFLGTL